MAINVKFLKGQFSDYNALASKDPNTFYYLSDAAQLYLGTIKLSNSADIDAVIGQLYILEDDIEEVKTKLGELIGVDGNGSIMDMIDNALRPVKSDIGTLSELGTTSKDSLVEAINEVSTNAEAIKTNRKVSISESSDSAYSKIYTLSQGGDVVGVIEIPRDMVVSSGKVVVNPAGQAAGTYIELTLANAENSKIYVNVGHLVDIYTAAQSATEVQLAINASTREISATIVNSSITTGKLANNAVTTAKIADSNVTLVKLDKSVRDSLALADSSVQKIISGTEAGTIKVDGTDVHVTGLGSAAFLDADQITEAADEVRSELNSYKNTNDTKVNQLISSIEDINNTSTGILASAKAYADSKDAEKLNQAKAYADSLSSNYATAAQGAKADTALQKSDIIPGTANGTISVKGANVSVTGLKSAAFTESTAYDPAGTGVAAGASALTQAKAYIDDALTWGTI